MKKKIIPLLVLIVFVILVGSRFIPINSSNNGEYNASSIGHGESIIAMCPWFSGAIDGNCVSKDPINFPIGTQQLFKIKAGQSYANGWLCSMASNNKPGIYHYEVGAKCRIGIRPILGVLF